MSTTKLGGKRNYGFGKQMSFAAKNIIDDMMILMGQGSSAAYRVRINCFVMFLTSCGVKDFRQVCPILFKQYGQYLVDRVREESLAVATAVNYLSAANCFMRHIRQDDVLTLSPSETIGPRDYVRKVAPTGLRIVRFPELLAVDSLRRSHGAALVTVLGLCRFSGVRFREAALMPLDKALRSFHKSGHYNITRGTKGGRSVTRFVPANDQIVETLEFARENLNSRTVIPSTWNLKRFYGFAYRNMPHFALELGLSTGFHDLRASYTCARYEQLTGFDAPVVIGLRSCPRQVDEEARQVLAIELGHSRSQILTSYLGSAR